MDFPFKSFSLSQTLHKFSPLVTPNHIYNYNPLYELQSAARIIQLSFVLAAHQIQRYQLAVDSSSCTVEKSTLKARTYMLLKSKEKQPVFTQNRTGLLWLVSSKQVVTIHYRPFVAAKTWSFVVTIAYYYEATQKLTKLLFLEQHLNIFPKPWSGHNRCHDEMVENAALPRLRYKQIQHFTEFYSWELWQLAFNRIKIWN